MFSNSRILRVFPPFAPEGGKRGVEDPPQIEEYPFPHPYTQYETLLFPYISIYIYRNYLKLFLAFSFLPFYGRNSPRIEIFPEWFFYFLGLIYLFVYKLFSLSLTQVALRAVKVKPKKNSHFF